MLHSRSIHVMPVCLLSPRFSGRSGYWLWSVAGGVSTPKFLLVHRLSRCTRDSCVKRRVLYLSASAMFRISTIDTYDTNMVTPPVKQVYRKPAFTPTRRSVWALTLTLDIVMNARVINTKMICFISWFSLDSNKNNKPECAVCVLFQPRIVRTFIFKYL